MKNKFSQNNAMRLLINLRNTLLIGAAAFAMVACGGGENGNDPIPQPPVQVTPVSYDVKADIAEIEAALAKVKIDIASSNKDVKGFKISGDLSVKESNFATMRQIGDLKTLLGTKFVFNGTVLPLGDILLTLAEWNGWGKLTLGAGWFVSEAEKDGFAGQPVTVDTRWNGLKKVSSVDYGTDGSVLKTVLPDTIVHSVHGADAQGLKHLTGYGAKKIVIKTVGDAYWINMDDEVLDLWESPAAPDYPESPVKPTYKFEANPVITEYVQLGDKPKTNGSLVIEFLRDTLSGNQSYLKLNASNKIAQKHVTYRPVITAKNNGVVKIKYPDAAGNRYVKDHLNPSGIYTRPTVAGQKKTLEAGKYFCLSLANLEKYGEALYDKSWAEKKFISEYNNISLYMDSKGVVYELDAYYTRKLIDEATLVMTAEEAIAGALQNDMGISVNGADASTIEYVTATHLKSLGGKAH